MKKLIVYSISRVLKSMRVYSQRISMKIVTTRFTSIREIISSKMIQMMAAVFHKNPSPVTQSGFSFNESGLPIQHVPVKFTSKGIQASTFISYAWFSYVILIKACFDLMKNT
jgi:hypothetical protein